MTSSTVVLEKVEAAALDRVLKSPLILGASVSQGFLADSPGKVLAKRYTEAKNIRTIAYNGSSSIDVLRRAPTESFADRSVVIAIDLFFWDSILSSPDASLKGMHRLFKEVSERKIPLVVGDIPDLLPSRQPQAARLNQELRTLCAQTENCAILSLDRLAKSLVRTGQLEYKGQRYSILDLVPDGLHISPTASAFLADEIAELLQ